MNAANESTDAADERGVGGGLFLYSPPAHDRSRPHFHARPKFTKGGVKLTRTARTKKKGI